jgi:hypothetical protein
MKSEALQGLISKIFSDEKTRLQFMSDPDSVLSRFKLTEQEKSAVLSANAKLALTTADSQQLEAIVGPTAIWH